MKKIFSLIVFILCAAFCVLAEEAVSPSLSADGAHALAVDKSGRVWAWGSNHIGESNPFSDETSILTPTKVFENAVSVACGQQFSMVLTKNGDLYAWGDNREGQIPSCGDTRAGEFVLICSGIIQMDACDLRAAAVSEDGSLHAWGGGEEMRVLSENAVKCAVGLDFVLELDKDGNVYEYDESGEKTLKVQACSDIDASGESRYALARDGRLYAWGANASDGRLGIGSSETAVTSPTKIDIGNVSEIRAGLSMGGCILEDHTLAVWGSVYSYLTHIDAQGETLAALMDGALITYGSTPLPLYENVLDAAFGDAFVMLLFEDGSVYTWGSNDHGQLGNGTRTETALFEDEEGDGYELTVVSAAQGIFPSVPINLFN